MEISKEEFYNEKLKDEVLEDKKQERRTRKTPENNMYVDPVTNQKIPILKSYHSEEE